MIVTNIAGPAESLLRLQPITPVIYSALEYGTQKVREYFDHENKEIDPFLAPSIVRFHAKVYLLSHGLTVGDDEEIDFGLENLSNNGLALFHAGLHVRILRASLGWIPAAGRSEARQDFWKQDIVQQYHLFTSVGDFEPAEPIRQNVIFLWDTTSAYNLTDILLVCTSHGGPSRFDTHVHWTEPIPHPGAALGELEPEASEAQELPIEPPQAPSQTGTDENE